MDSLFGNPSESLQRPTGIPDGPASRRPCLPNLTAEVVQKDGYATAPTMAFLYQYSGGLWNERCPEHISSAASDYYVAIDCQ